MHTAAIVAEYNPLHSGHFHHIEETRRAGMSHIIAVMSGGFVQRGEPAILSKFTRAALAVRCGVDLVLELPAPYATASSERFAFGALSILDRLGIVDTLSFGSECGDIAALERAVDAVCNAAVIDQTRRFYEQGESYPIARRKAVAGLCSEKIAAILDKPNNLLGVDYIKALRRLDSAIRPFTISRRGAGHDSPIATGGFASASQIRELLLAEQDVSDFVPTVTASAVATARETGQLSGGLAVIERLVLHRLRGMTTDALAALPDCADGLGHRLSRAAAQAVTLDELYTLAKTKRYTHARVRRAVAAALLDITPALYIEPPYARILAIGLGGGELLAAIKQRGTITLSSNLKQLIAQGEDAAKYAAVEARATDLFALTTQVVTPAGGDYTQKLYVANAITGR